MVVILLLPPYSTNGCDGRSSNESSSPATTASTTSTGDTAIPAASYAAGHHQPKSGQEDEHQHGTGNGSYFHYPQYHHQANQTGTTTLPDATPTIFEYNTTQHPHHHQHHLHNTRISATPTDEESNTSHYHCFQSPGSISPPPPPLPTSRPPSYVPFSSDWLPPPPPPSPPEPKLCNVVPKPPRYRSQQTLETIPEHVSDPVSTSPPANEDGSGDQPSTNSAFTGSIPVSGSSYHKKRRKPPASQLQPITTTNNAHNKPSFNDSNYFTNTTTNYVRHVTRVNFYDVDTSQVEYESRDYDGDDGEAANKDDCDLDDDNDCNIEAITKEEEWITKRKTELTTTRQIETHVKRSIRFEDGKVIEDSGPIVSTNTTEDTDKQETETTEKHDLGLPVNSLNNGGVDGKSKGALPPGNGPNGELAELAGSGGTLVKSLVPRPADGLVREINDKRVVSHEETKNYIEVEDVQHRGDFSDEAFIKAVTSGVENVEEVLFSPDSQKQLIPAGPRVIADKTKSFKTIDTEDVVKRSLAQEDGKIITEQKKTTEHEIIVDKQLSDDDDGAKSTGSQERIKTIETNQRFFKQRDEQHVDLVKDGKVVGTEMKYAAETMQMDNDDMLERPDDWDSLSDRMRKMRKPYNKSVMQHPKAGAILMDRKDALTKRPLDFDREEETRKGETIKWLESHFGSESTASNDSREDEVDVIEPTKRTYFNVTIKSNQNQTPPTNPPYESGDKKVFAKRSVESMNGGVATTNGAKYYQGISNWSNRKETTAPATTPANHFASKAFRDDLHASIERSQLRKTSAVYASKDNLNSDNAPYVKSNPSDSYVSREDILQQKRQSLSSQFLARSRQNSRDRLDDVDRIAAPASFADDDDRYISGSRTDLHYGLNVKEKEKRSYTRAEVMDEPDSPAPPRKASYVEERAKSYERTFVENNRYNSLQRSDKGTPQREIATLERPVVPQRRRNGEKKLRQQHEPVMIDLKTPIEINVPPPDYSPPPRSRSSSPPHDDFHKVRAKSYPHQLYPNSSSQEQMSARETSTLLRKQNQRTRFARNTPSPPPSAGMHHHHPHHHQSQTLRPSMQTTQTQTTPSTISTSTVQSHRSSKVGSAIGNSLRKLVGKLRSASVERKLRMKSKSKSRDHSPAPPPATSVGQNQRNVTTYQQYNVIDGHIGGGGGNNLHNTTSHEESEDELSTHQRIQYQASKTGDSVYSNASVDRRAMLHSTSSHPVVGNSHRDNYRRQESLVSPKQRYYLGEDPYSSTLYGKENVQDNGKVQRNGGTTTIHYNGRDNNNSTSTHTLGRYQKGNSRFSGSTPNLNTGYRSTQTLPRKLNDQQPTIHQYETQTMNISRSNVTGKVQSKLRQQQQQQQAEQRIAYQPIGPNTGPLKPARTYAKSLNRSKSFSVHAMNGSNDPSPIYMEKLNGNNSNNYHNNLQSSHAYKSNPHLYSSSKENGAQQTPLKSPSIVNLISRSQRDLTKIGTNEDESDTYGERQGYTNNRKYYDERKATPPYRSGSSHIEDEYKYRAPGHYHLQQKHSLDSRGSVEINKDTASIIRHEEYVRSKRAPPPAGSTIIKVRNMDYRK